MLDPIFAYFGPEVTMPLASIIGAIVSVLMLFGRNILAVARRLLRAPQRKVRASVAGAPQSVDPGPN